MKEKIVCEKFKVMAGSGDPPRKWIHSPLIDIHLSENAVKQVQHRLRFWDDNPISLRQMLKGNLHDAIYAEPLLNNPLIKAAIICGAVLLVIILAVGCFCCFRSKNDGSLRKTAIKEDDEDLDQ